MAHDNNAMSRARSSAKKSQTRSRGRGEGWVRKNVVMDQRKLDAARRVLGVETETEAIDVALDLVAFRRELVRGIASVRGAGGIETAHPVIVDLPRNDRQVAE